MSKPAANAKRRSKANPENLYQRKGIWWIRYSIGGRKIRRSLGTKSVREAKRMRDQILAKRSTAAKFGIEAPNAEPIKTFAEVAEMWMRAREADLSLAASTRHLSVSTTTRLLIPEFGHMRMNMIKVEDIERFISRLHKKYKRRTVALYFGILGILFRQVIKRGWYHGPNPLDQLERTPTPGPGRDVTLTVEEARCLLSELSGVIRYKSGLALYTGLRWGEVHGLAWADISLNAQPPTLTVRRSYRGKTKNQASAATIPLSCDAVSLLQEWRQEQSQDTLWVFPRRDGTLWKQNPGRDRPTINQAAIRAGISKRVTPHVFRHTFGTWVYEQTHDVKAVQRLMRHASFHSSMGYVHDRRELSSVVERLPSLTME